MQLLIHGLTLELYILGPFKISNEVLAKIKRTCKFLADGRIEIPIMEKSLIAKA